VEAHGFQPWDRKKKECGFSRCDMDFAFERTFFVTSVTWRRRPAFQCERNAELFLKVLFEYRQSGIFLLHEFVLMPDHFHLLLTPRTTVAIERAMQFVKGGFSYRLKKETGSRMEIWERSFTNHRIRDERDYQEHSRYIQTNPVRARLVAHPEQYAHSSANPEFALDRAPQRLKPVA